MEEHNLTTTTRCIRVRVPDEHYKLLGHLAVDEGRSLGALIREAVRRFLDADSGQPARR